MTIHRPTKQAIASTPAIKPSTPAANAFTTLRKIRPTAANTCENRHAGRRRNGRGATLAPGAAAPELLSISEGPEPTALQPTALSISDLGVCWTGGLSESFIWMTRPAIPEPVQINFNEIQRRPWQVSSIVACHAWANTPAGSIEGVDTSIGARLPSNASELVSGLRSPDSLAGDGKRLGWVEGGADIRLLDP